MTLHYSSESSRSECLGALLRCVNISESSYGDGPKPAEKQFRALLLISFLSEWSRILKRPWWFPAVTLIQCCRMRLSFFLFWFSLSSDLFYFSFLSSNFWSISRREAGCWWDLICSRFSFLSFALARLPNMLPMMNTFAALNLFYCLFFASLFDSRECFSFLNVSSQFLYLVFHFNTKFFFSSSRFCSFS